MLCKVYILLAITSSTCAWKTRQPGNVTENIKRPGSGAPREYDLGFANFLPVRTLPVMRFRPNTRDEVPPVVLDLIFKRIGNTSLQKKHRASIQFYPILPPLVLPSNIIESNWFRNCKILLPPHCAIKRDRVCARNEWINSVQVILTS